MIMFIEPRQSHNPTVPGKGHRREVALAKVAETSHESSGARLPYLNALRVRRKQELAVGGVCQAENWAVLPQARRPNASDCPLRQRITEAVGSEARRLSSWFRRDRRRLPVGRRLLPHLSNAPGQCRARENNPDDYRQLHRHERSQHALGEDRRRCRRRCFRAGHDRADGYVHQLQRHRCGQSSARQRRCSQCSRQAYAASLEPPTQCTAAASEPALHGGRRPAQAVLCRLVLGKAFQVTQHQRFAEAIGQHRPIPRAEWPAPRPREGHRPARDPPAALLRPRSAGAAALPPAHCGRRGRLRRAASFPGRPGGESNLPCVPGRERLPETHLLHPADGLAPAGRRQTPLARAARPAPRRRPRRAGSGSTAEVRDRKFHRCGGRPGDG